MNILVIGGIYSETAKFNNVVCSLIKQLSISQSVSILSISNFPYPKISVPDKNYHTIQPKVSFSTFILSVKNIKETKNFLSGYVNFFSIYGFVGTVRFLLNMSQLQLLLKNYIPDIVHIHSTDLERSAFIYEILKRDIPSIVTIHGLYSLDSNIISPYNSYKLENYLLKSLNEKKVFVTFVSNGIKKAAIEKFHLIDENLFVIPNGVDQDKFHPIISRDSYDSIKDKYHIPKNKSIILQVGTVYKLKNHISVLKAIKKMDTTLKDKIFYVIVGDGEEKEHLKNFCNENNLNEHCKFVGAKHGKDLLELYNIANFLIIPSTTEAFPLVALESLAMGVPIITYKDLWNTQDIYNQNCMVLIPDRTLESLINSIKIAIAYRWDKNFIINYSKQFSWEKITKQYLELYNKAIN